MVGADKQGALLERAESDRMSDIGVRSRTANDARFRSLMRRVQYEVEEVQWFLYKQRGFTLNERQHRQATLAAIDVAQHAREQWLGKASADAHGGFGVRVMFELAVKWRQFSEPSDGVFWIDHLPSEYMAELGSHTCMVVRRARA